MDPIGVFFIIVAVIIVIGIILYVISYYLSQKRLSDAVESLNLIEGNHYNVTTKNGNKHLDVTYSRISYGNRSKNGNINLYFIKNSKEIMIKYDNISRIEKTNQITTVTIKRTDNIGSVSSSSSFVDNQNAENRYSNKLTAIIADVTENIETPTAADMYDCARKIFELERPAPQCVVRLHYSITDIASQIYKLRDTDDTALEYCLKVCDMDISLYPNVRRASLSAFNDDFVYSATLSRKIIILEKLGQYDEAIALCDLALENGYKTSAHDVGSESFAKQKARIIKKSNNAKKVIPNKTIVDEL